MGLMVNIMEEVDKAQARMNQLRLSVMMTHARCRYIISSYQNGQQSNGSVWAAIFLEGNAIQVEKQLNQIQGFIDEGRAFAKLEAASKALSDCTAGHLGNISGYMQGWLVAGSETNWRGKGAGAYSRFCALHTGAAEEVKGRCIAVSGVLTRLLEALVAFITELIVTIVKYVTNVVGSAIGGAKGANGIDNAVGALTSGLSAAITELGNSIEAIIKAGKDLFNSLHNEMDSLNEAMNSDTTYFVGNAWPRKGLENA